ncbi:MAG: acyl-CoA dehydrogenase family protein, partial [Acidimicrobiaceae bacterium]|nr:acyl-CoA dehydrogenase family protein [Acidimicrobiaceae bacterium]
MLNLDFTQEQDMLREMVRGLCAEFSPLERVRALEDDPDGIARDLWQRFGELGLCGLMVPENAGGSGMSLLDGVVLYEELGRSLAPVPHYVSCVLSAAAIAEAGTSAQKAELLGGIASGEHIATVGWLEPGGGYKPRGVQLAARANGDGFVLDGSKA